MWRGVKGGKPRRGGSGGRRCRGEPMVVFHFVHGELWCSGCCDEHDE